MEREVYAYTDDLGRKKEFRVTKLPDGKGYSFSIWDLATGECCSAGGTTEANLWKFLLMSALHDGYDNVFRLLRRGFRKIKSRFYSRRKE